MSCSTIIMRMKRVVYLILMSGVFYVNKVKGISKEVAYLLYGDKLIGSVTRLGI